MRKPRIGLALGSGSARGWAHIGVVQALGELGVHPEIVCGTSIGSLVGAAYVSGQLDPLEAWVRKLSRFDILRYMDFGLRGPGLIRGERLMERLSTELKDVAIEELPGQFACVATELRTGRELWLQEGRLMDAVRASVALPGLFTPILRDGEWIVDGGLVNPVPVSVCRALGADLVIAVNLNGDIVGKHSRPQQVVELDEVRALQGEQARTGGFAVSIGELKERAGALVAQLWPHDEEQIPGMFDVVTGALAIMQDRITRSRMAGDPPDLLLAPRMGHVGLLEFDRAEEAITEGRETVQRMLPAIRHLLAS